MRLAVTNLAWPAGEDDEAASILERGGVEGVELALTRYWMDPADASADEIADVGRAWRARGFEVVALQSLLYGQPHLRLFDDAVRAALLDRLIALGRAAEELGAPVMVFGSPKQRRRGLLPESDALRWAAQFFSDVATALPDGVAIVVESNPEQYGCDFLTSPDQVLDFVREVDHPAVRLHLDLACAHLAGTDPVGAAAEFGAVAAHVHASEPELRPLGDSGALDHDAAGDALRSVAYSNAVCAEVLSGDDWRAALTATVTRLARAYG